MDTLGLQITTGIENSRTLHAQKGLHVKSLEIKVTDGMWTDKEEGGGEATSQR